MIANGKLKGKRSTKGDRKSIIALLATACASAYYVHDVGTELLALLNLGTSSDYNFEAEIQQDARQYGRRFLQDTSAWQSIREIVGYSARHNKWGEAANGFSEAVNT
jgi:hypothetical protein